MVVPARLERATPAFGRRCSAPLSYGTEIDRALVRPGGVEPPTALQSGAHDGYKPSALPVELWAQYEWSGWLDSNQRPPASEAGTLAGLSYTLLALRREIESLSPDRQSGRLTRCVTERELVRLGRLERPLNALSTHSLCQLGYRRVIIRYRRGHGREQGLEDQAGFEPAVGASQRIKSPPRSAATVTGPMISRLSDPGGFEPHADGLKVRSLSIRV